MGYHVTILRTKDASYIPIEFEEVQKAINSLNGWEYIRQDNAFVKTSENNDSCILWYDNGELWTKTPSDWALEQMLDLAPLLSARVRGDEFETYKTIDRWYIHPDDIQFKKEAKAVVDVTLAKEKKEQNLIRMIIIGFFVLLGAIGYIIGKSFEK
jgi:hypothetical protein